ncbi:hypothetical protein BJV82DRAFT_284640 [Fennellomyces sp. T-0311]|nr:hypothetical protein BJV82DRAFT_284640 [Fennellomyces sp. T-0311]
MSPSFKRGHLWRQCRTKHVKTTTAYAVTLFAAVCGQILNVKTHQRISFFSFGNPLLEDYINGESNGCLLDILFLGIFKTMRSFLVPVLALVLGTVCSAVTYKKISANCYCLNGRDGDFIGTNNYATRQCCDKSKTAGSSPPADERLGYYFTPLDFCTRIDLKDQQEYQDCCQQEGAAEGFCSGPMLSIFPTNMK